MIEAREVTRPGDDPAPPPPPFRRAAPQPLNLADLMGTVYKPGGRCVREGLDCWGLMRLVMARLNVHLPREPSEALASDATARLFVSVPMRPDGGPAEVLRQGDVLELEGEDPVTKEPQLHLGVALNAFQFIHATRPSGVRLDRIDVFVRNRHLRGVLRARALGGVPA